MDDKADAPDSQPGDPSSRRSRLNRTIFLSLIVMVVAFYVSNRAGGWWRGRAPTEREFETMNTYARIAVPEGAGGLTPSELADRAEQAVRRVAELMSPAGEMSDVRRLNDASAGEWVAVDPLTWTVVMEALRWHRLSGGAFDPTIGPVKRLFVFDQSEAAAWPTAELAAARQKVGADKLLFRREGMLLSWRESGMALDLGAIAKGFAADLAAGELIRHGVAGALVDIGGEIRSVGRRPGEPGGPWRVGVRNPRAGGAGANAGGDVLETLDVFDAGVATSGDYERFFIYKGKRYEHIIDPRTGLPLTEAVAGVTVLHPSSCLAADALATALCVLGPDDGEAFLREQALGLFSGGVRVIMLLVEGEGLKRIELGVAPGGGEVTRSEETITETLE